MSNLERTPEYGAKFVQITNVSDRIIALDEEGNIWRFAWSNDSYLTPQKCWHLICAKRYVPPQTD